MADIIGGEVVTELVKQLHAVSQKAFMCRGIAQKLATMIEGLQPNIKEIQYSGVELSPHRQAQLRMFSETLEKCRKIADKVLKSSRGNMIQQVIHVKKLENLEIKISSFLNCQLLLHVIADIHSVRADSEDVTFSKLVPPNLRIRLWKQNSLERNSSMASPKVFLNFRGAELRQSFIAHLEMALIRGGVNVYVDGGEHRGINHLFEGIEESSVALVILSKRYTESSWCLDELVKIKERVEQGKLMAIPIFYKLEPSQVRRLDGDFGSYLWELGKREFDKLKGWKEALEFISNTVGLVLNEKKSYGFYPPQVLLNSKSYKSVIN